MPKDPTTVSEVQAYRFMLRRMESALVRKDAVMLHEPLRAHNKAALVGVILGMLGLVAFFVVGRFSPTSQLEGGEIVIGKSSSAVFVVQPQPRRLIPVLNMASARLLLSVLSPGATSAPDATVVDESVLNSLPHTSTTGIPGAPTRLPGTQDLVPGPWSVCDTGPASSDLPDAQASQAPTVTTALLGVPKPGRSLGPDQALLVQAPGSPTTYLVRDGHRNQVDLGARAVVGAYRLHKDEVRTVSAGLINAIPEGHPLTPPADIPTGSPVPPLPSSVHTGDVVQVARAEGKEFFLLLPQGKQSVTEGVANLILYAGTSLQIQSVNPDAIAQVADAPKAYQEDFSGYPDATPTILDPAATTNICANISDPNHPPLITTSPDPQLPLGQGDNPVQVPNAVNGRTADSVVVPPGKGALVRGAVPGQPPNTGQIWLVTEQGQRYAVPSLQVAQILGLGNATSPAPEPILDLLPQGPTLDPQKALQLFNSATANQQQGGG